jgi:phenylacetate-CoA ligase
VSEISLEDLKYQSRKQATLSLLESHQKDSRTPSEVLEIELAQRFKKLIPILKQSIWWNKVISQNEAQILNAQTLSELVSHFPVLTRPEVQKLGDQLRISLPGVKPEEYTQHTTSGSTGKPVTVFRHQKQHRIQHSAKELLDVLWQGRDVSSSVAYLRMPPENDEHSSWGEPFTYLGRTGKAYRLSLVTNTLPQLLDFLVEKNIKLFLVNPMVVKFLIQEQLRNPRPGASVEQILTWADRVDPELRQQTREVFGATISDRYSSTEFGFLAIQCPYYEHLHVLQFSNYLEILNKDNLPCQLGEPGRVVVTSLENLAMPLIRYELGDVAAFGEPCEHGINLPVIEPKIVRAREAVVLPDGRLEIPYVDGTELAKYPSVLDLQAYRFEDGLVVVFEAESEVPESVIESTREHLTGVFRTSNKVQIVQLPSLKFLGVWKRKMVLDVPDSIPSELPSVYFEKLEEQRKNNSR